MKKTIIFLVIFVVYISCKPDSRPKLKLSTYTYDFGHIENNKLYTGYIYVYNKGRENLHINNIKGDCGCTNVTISKYNINYKDSAKIKFTLDTSKRYGEITNFIIIEANTDSALHYVQLFATVE